jgi:hypothetical protein
MLAFPYPLPILRTRSGRAKSAAERSLWTSFRGRRRSLSGVELVGDWLVRFVYLDESGISANERIAVVAGAIVNADHQWKVLQQYVDGLIEEYVPHEKRRGFVLHATHLFHGSGPIFDRRIYPQERRWEALKKLIGIPAKFRVPIVYGYHTKSAIPLDQQQPTAQKRARTEQVLAFSLCAIAAERFTREKATPSEVATLVAENNNEVKRVIKAIHHLLGAPEALAVLQAEAVQAYLPRALSLCVRGHKML